MYFFGELIPPYIDKLGRGAHLRPTDSDNTLYQSEGKCYRNQQALGSKASLVRGRWRLVEVDAIRNRYSNAGTEKHTCIVGPTSTPMNVRLLSLL